MKTEEGLSGRDENMRRGRLFRRIAMKKVWLMSAAVLFFGMIGQSHAEVFAYETFRYEAGEIIGIPNSSLGFTGPWTNAGGDSGRMSVEPLSLAFAGTDAALQSGSGMFQVRVPNFDGARAGCFLDMDPNGVFSEYINAEGTIGKPGQSIYLSFLMKSTATNPFFAFELKDGDLGDGGARLYIGNDMGGSDLQVCAYRNKDTSAANLGREFQWLGAATTGTELYVVRIDFGTTGDNVTVYRNPSLDAEPVKSPDLVNSRFLDFDGISMCVWEGPAGRVGQFDEVCIASTYADVVRFYNKSDRAQNPSPADGAIDVTGTPGITLSWQAGAGVTPNGYKVYISDDLDEVLTADASAYQGTTTSADLEIGPINTDTTYYWSVTEIAEPNDIPGVVWTFETNKTLPTVVSQPTSQYVFAGSDASFSFDVASETPESYQWYDAGGMLTDSGNISGTQTATLTVTGAQIANEGQYYCEVTNDAGMITSKTVELWISRLVGYWSLNQPAGADPNLAWQDLSDSENDLQVEYTAPAAFEWVQGVDGTANGALMFDGQFALGTMKADGTMNDIPVGDQPYTISAWIKPDTGYNRGIVGWGNFGTDYQVNAVKLNNPSELWHYWWSADIGGNRGYSMVDENWHLVTVTYDKNTRSIYIDGLAVNQDHPVDHAVPTSENFLVGKTNTLEPDVEFFEGAMDEVKVFNYALSAVEIAAMYTDIMGGDVCVVPPAYDVTDDCRVNMDDIAALAAEWLDCGLVPACITAD